MTKQNINLIGGVKKWLNALMGKPQPKSASPQPDNIQQGVKLDKEEPKKVQVEQSQMSISKNSSPQAVQDQGTGEDSVKTDIKIIKSFTKKGTNTLKGMLKPYAQKGGESVTQTTKAVKGSVDNKFIKIVVRSFIILFFALILFFIAYYLFTRLKEEGDNTSNNNENVVVATPTPIYFDPYKPSIYAEDPEILRLEEEINILKGEISGITIKETGINPPKLDWEINFK
jgi:hypothetical protein